jgi:hypothetical protein
MSAEIKITAALECKHGNFSFPKAGAAQISVTQNAAGGGGPGMITATVAGVTVDLASLTGVTTAGWCRVQNLDGTNFVEWGAYDSTGGGTFWPVGKLLAGEPALFRCKAGVKLRFKADTANCKVQVQILEE